MRLARCTFLLAALLAPSRTTSAQQTGVLTGVVRDTARMPLPLVRVTVALQQPRTVLSDTAGGFRLDQLPAGVHRVSFRRIGYEPAEFSLLVEAGDSSRIVVELASVALALDAITVAGRTVYPDLQVAGFYDRLRQAREGAGVGRFITPEEMDRLRQMPKATHVVETAGVRLLQSEGGLILWPVGRNNMVLRGALGRLLTGPCQMAVFIDGLEVDIGSYFEPRGGGHSIGDGLDAFVTPNDIRAVEVYHSASGTPQQYQSVRNAQCGSIVIWTKAGPRQPSR